MEAEKQKYAKDLETFKSEISLNAQKEIEKLKADVEIFKTKEIESFKDKINIYRQAMDIISEALADLDLYRNKELDEEAKKKSFHKFNVSRLKNRAYMAMLSSPEIVQSFDTLIDEIISIYNSEKEYCWVTIRNISIPIIDTLRKDIAMSEGEIRYVGER
ncbi:hypothetical protein P20429_2050 [Pseudoalteromonas sp. BSi20429]|nr:hypothetical protein P20429_2050 [Pseudoalteromonas sp. BSi20429]